MTNKKNSPFPGLKALIVVLLGLGIFFRFVNIDKKVYWLDEAYTSLRISGHTRSEYVTETFANQVISVKDLQKYVQLQPDKEFRDTLDALTGNSEHPPLYYLLASLWVRLFGTTPAVTRSLSALISLLAFPCIYWLCLELFESSLTAWIAVAIIAVSPFHVLYAQEARQYSLWIVTILLSCAALLHAMRVRTIRNWGIYAVSLALGFYTFLFSALVAIAHGVYVIITERFRLTKASLAYLLALLDGVLVFVPWIVVIATNLNRIDKATAGAQQRQEPLFLVKTWISDLGQVFLDFKLGTFTAPLILLLVGYALYFLYRRGPKQASSFIFIGLGITALSIMLADLTLGFKLSTRPRYLIPAYLIIQVAIAYLLSTQILCAKSWQRQFWKGVLVLLISGGILSCAISSQSETWWNKGNTENPELAQIINQAPRPLIVSNNQFLNPDDLLSLSYLLEPEVQLQLVSGSTIPKIPQGFSDVFLYNPSDELKAGLEKEHKLDLVSKRGKLWSVGK